MVAMSSPDPRSRQRRGGPRQGAARQRASHSMEAVVGEAVAILDEFGESALTFRALAARLGGGVASIYWYVANKDELLDRATDHVLAGVLVDSAVYLDESDPIDAVRGIAVTTFDAVVARPWLASYFMRNTQVQANSLMLYERMGQQVMRLGLSPQGAFDAVSAVLGYVVGIATDLGQEPPQEFLDSDLDRQTYIGRQADLWRELDADEFPFLHHIADVFASHDDAEQFRAGLDLLLTGLRQQAGR